MADASQQRTVTAAFAPPPPLWKQFTRDNLDKLEQIKKEASTGFDEESASDKKWSPSELRALEVPPELRFLVPPEVPTGDYSVFGELQSMSTALPSLKDQGIDQLYPEPATETDQSKDASQPSQPLNHAYYLLKISKSLLLNFLEFVGALAVSPEQFESKVNDLRNLFINAHHLLNLYRPHQARESLVMMMEEQLQRSKDEIEQMDKVKAEIESALEQLETQGKEIGSAEQSTKDVETAEKNSQQSGEGSHQMWDVLGGEI
ncbi:Mediator complex subunit Med7 [Penicillium argentinense]|uniref:Mediator of RNA polymerase II transcription subunit 7 n=1 Tax=Penicillium argentinense TaxID=1131581 RepID=A0A9W9KP79_9EURO|nr:Mediator complex subunit Med7 [Penicillium argentinense]KAJ5112753.1 Mediator complex subunit Med7 [Penicillium argentinense]